MCCRYTFTIAIPPPLSAALHFVTHETHARRFVVGLFVTELGAALPPSPHLCGGGGGKPGNF